MGTGTLERDTLGVIVGKKKKQEKETTEDVSDGGKEMFSFRLTNEGRRMAGELSVFLGVSRTSVIEMGIRQLYRSHIEPEKKQK